MKFFKILIILVIFILVSHLTLQNIFQSSKKIEYGVTFSSKYARYLKLDWEKTFIDILDNLKVKNLRIPTYWNELEKESEKKDFSSVDFMVAEADKRGVRLIMVLGVRQPRWPECHIPKWAKKLSVQERKQKALDFIKAVLERYKNNSSIWAYQVENEPTFNAFGECDDADINFLEEEVKVVRSLTSKTIIITDSGEWGSWFIPMQLSDILGISLYRDVRNPILGYITYPIPQYFYPLKSKIIKALFVPKNLKTILIEVQTEPWLKNGVLGQNADEQEKIFSVDKFRSIIEFSKQTGFDEQYLWGIEWWYFMAQNGYPEYLQYAKSLF